MRRALLVFGSLLLLASPLHADTYFGCGSQFGTCASVTVQASPLPNGEWDITVTVQNLGFGKHPGSSMIARVGLRGITGAHGLTVTNGARDLSENVMAFDDYDFDDQKITTLDGYQETSADLPDGSTVVDWARITGSYDARCAAKPSCDKRRFLSHGSSGSTNEDWIPAVEYVYAPGAVVYHFQASSYQPGRPTVEQWFIGGKKHGDFENYALHSTVTPEPLSMTLLATGLAGVGLARRKAKGKKT